MTDPQPAREYYDKGREVYDYLIPIPRSRQGETTLVKSIVTQKRTMASGKVLILDENHATRTQLRELLPKGQYEIQEAGDGERGLSLIQQERSNIRFIILDSALPKVNGWDVLERLQADAELQRIPLVMMTGLTDAPSSSYPMVEFLQKPFEKKELRTVVKNAIGKAISIYQEILRDREEVSLSRSDREKPIVEEPILTEQHFEGESAIDLDNVFESFVESERDRVESEEFFREPEETGSEERELDFSFDTTGTEDAIDKEEMAALGLSFPALDATVFPEEIQEVRDEKSDIEIDSIPTDKAIEIEKMTSFDSHEVNEVADFSFDTTGTDETIDIRELEALRQEESQTQQSEEESLDLASVDLSSSLEESHLEEFNDDDESSTLDLESNVLSAAIEDEEPEIDEFPSLDLDLLSEDLSPEIDEFPSLDLDLLEDQSPEIDEFPSLDIDLSEDLSPEIDELPSLDINLSSEELSPGSDELGLEISAIEELPSESKNEDKIDITLEKQPEENRENLEETFVVEQQDLNWQDLDLTSETENLEPENLEIAANERLSLDESFANLEFEESLESEEEENEEKFELEYSSRESEALIDESFANLELEESWESGEEASEDNFDLEYSSRVDSPPETPREESQIQTRFVSLDRLAPIDSFSEDTENIPVSSELDVNVFDKSEEARIFRESEQEIEPYNTSDEDIREDYHRNKSQEESIFDPSLTLNPTEEIQFSTEDIFSASTPSELQLEETEDSSDRHLTSPPPWDEQTPTASDRNESDSIFDSSLQLEHETIAYPADTDSIFPPLGETDLFESEPPANESLISETSSSDSFMMEEFDREFPAGDRQSKNEEEYTILEDKRSTPIALPEEDREEEATEEHTILEDKRSRQTSENVTETTEENPRSELESELTILEDKKSVDLSSQSFNIEPFVGEQSDHLYENASKGEPDRDLVNLETETPLQLNKIFTESDRETEISHLVNLSGFEDVLMRYKSTVEEVKISALQEAFDYDEPGYRLIIHALREESLTIRQTAEQLLIEHLKKPRIQVLSPHENWTSLQCLHTLRGHSYWVQDVAIAPNCRTIVSASKDGTIKIWDLVTGREMRTLHGHESAVLSVAISADGERIISCGTDNAIKIWSLDTGMELNTILGKSHNIYVLAVSPDGKTVVSASADNTIKPKYNGGLEAFLSRIPSRRVNALLSLIGLLKRSPAIKIWDLDRGRPKGNFRGYSRGVTDLAISPKGDKVVSGSRDRTIKIWDFKTGKNLDTLWGHNDEIRSVVISPDGKTIISGSRDRTIKIWDMQSGHVLRTLRGHGQSVTSVAISPDGNIIASGSRDSTIKIWDFHTGEFINTLLGHTDLVRSVAIDAEGKTIISGSRDNTIKVWGNVYQ
ncbi:MAG: response regulator [Spirulina sp.]